MSATTWKCVTAECERRHGDRFGDAGNSGPRIVLIDDNPHDRALVIRALRREFPAVHVIEVTGPAELATALLAGDFDLVITDYVMGWIDGLRVLRGVKSRMPKVPVIMFTGTGNEEVAVEAMKAGLDDYVVKRAHHYPRVAATVSTTLARLRAERARDEISNRLRDMLERLSIGVFRATLGGRLRELNPACRRMLGVAGHDGHDGDGGDDGHDGLGRLQDYCSARHREELTHLLHDLEEVRGYELTIETTGTLVELRTAHEVQADGTTIVVGWLEDVSDRGQRRELERKLARSERLAALGRLAAGVAHEINNPATFVLLNQERLRRRLDALVSRLGARQRAQLSGDLDRMHTMLVESGSGVERIAAIVRELKLFGGSSEREVAPVALDDLVRWACNLVEHEVEGRARLSCDLDDAPTIAGDRGRLSQVVINLLSNAAHAIDPGAPSRHSIRIAATTDEDMALLTVEDTGSGIPSDVLEHIFEPFFTTKPMGVGTGLGLPIVAEIVREHGGTIDVQSNVGAGTRIEVRLPRERGAWALRPRVLVVDADPVRLRESATLLAPSCEIVTALGSDAALAHLREDTALDGVVCDLPSACANLYRAATHIAPNLARRFILLSEAGNGPSLRHSFGDQQLTVFPAPLPAPLVVEQIRTWLSERGGF